jgi:ribosomal protein S18 acetylase RimI-like enzyme
MMRSVSADAALQITRLSMESAASLVDLLRAIDAVDDKRWFRPHPFDPAHVDALCNPARRDLHYIMRDSATAIGYGLLRGWDEGYPTPSLGIAVRPGWRGLGFGTSLMQFLHSAARLRGADRVRLRVHAANRAAIELYQHLGYAFEETPSARPADGLLVAFKELK